MLAFLGLGTVVIAEIIARANNELTPPFFNILAGAASLAALAVGAYAQITQMHRWSRRVKRRLLVGLPVALLNAMMVTANFFDTYETPGNPASAPSSNRREVPPPPQEDNALVKPGWYGELQQEGLLLVVTSFGDNAAETKRFEKRLFKPVSYASLSLINLGSSVPIILQSLEVGLHMDSGEVVKSLPVKPLLEQKADTNTALLRLLTAPYTLAAGAMLPDIPVCQETNFPWARVTAVTVSLSSHDLTIPGRMMTAAEKQTMLEKTTANRKTSGTNITAEAWFKNL